MVAFLPFTVNATAKSHFYHSSYHSSYYSSSSSSHSFSKPSSSSYKSSSSSTFSKPISHAATTESSPTFSKPTLSPSSLNTSKVAGSSFSKPGSATTVVKPNVAPSAGLAAIVTRSQSKSSLAAFTTEQNRYKSPPFHSYSSITSARSSPMWQTYGRNYRTSDDYWAARNRFAATQPPLPSYVVNGPPSYGGIAAAFLGGMLLEHITNPSYAEYAYSMQGNPGFDQWRSDMNQQAQTNADLKAQLASMDQQVSQLQAHNAAKNTALPQGVDPAYAIAPSTALMATSHSGIGFFGWLGIILLIVIVFGVVFVLAMKWLARKVAA
jgi:hypothetical protein